MRRNSSFQPKTPLKSGKLPVAEPTSFQKFAVILLMHLCRKVLLVPPSLKVAIYLISVSVGSLITDLIPMPRTIFAHPGNVFNLYFVKLGWGWTFCLLAVFIYLTSSTYCCGNINLVKRHLSRLLVGTFWWFTCTKFFNVVESLTGSCTLDRHRSEKACLEAGYRWYAFDISGHAFLLVHCLLIIAEEAKCINGWDKIPEVVLSEEENPTQRLSISQLNQLKISYDANTPLMRINLCFLTLLYILWEIMLLATILYFHNMPQKLTGACFAAGAWLFTYRVWYKMDMSPGEPGKGGLRYMKEIW